MTTSEIRAEIERIELRIMREEMADFMNRNKVRQLEKELKALKEELKNRGE